MREMRRVFGKLFALISQHSTAARNRERGCRHLSLHNKELPPRMAFLNAAHMASFFGILGNVLSFLVFLAPLPTFYKIYKKKSTEGFQSLPYSVALFSAFLLLYYGFLKINGLMLITINGIGCAIESFYLILFMIYATKEARVYTTKLLLLFNVGAFGIMLLSTLLLFKGHRRLSAVGWICAVFSVCVFASPLSIMRQVIKTKSVEYMPFPLSFCLTLSAVMWFFYGFLTKDFYIATPNILGFVFGMAQMVLYIIYKDSKKAAMPGAKAAGPEAKLQDLTTAIDLKVVEMQENVKPEGTNALVANNDAANKPIQPSEANV